MQSNRGGIGARVRVTVREAGKLREIHRALGSLSSFGGSPLRLEIGLGGAEAIEGLSVRWPDGTGEDVFTQVPMDAYVEITQGVPELRALPLSAVRFAGED